MYTYLVIYKSSLNGRIMEKTAPANTPEEAKDIVRRCCSVERFIGDPLKLY